MVGGEIAWVCWAGSVLTPYQFPSLAYVRNGDSTAWLQVVGSWAFLCSSSWVLEGQSGKSWELCSLGFMLLMPFFRGLGTYFVIYSLNPPEKFIVRVVFL